MSTQKALYIPSKQAPLKLGEAPIYTPGPKEVLVKVISTALNPVDWKIHTYGLFVEKFPAILGSDISGVVEQIGAEVTKFAKGDRVLFQGWFSDTKHAGFQQYTLVDAELAAKIPDNISFDQASSVPVALVAVILPNFNHNLAAKTANFTAPWEEGGQTKYAGKPAFIVGGSSSVGQYAIQVAKYSGYSPINTTASLHNEALLKSLGANAVLDRKLPASSILSELQKLAGGKPLEYAFDAISFADTQTLAYDALAPGGTLFIVLNDEIPEGKKKAGGDKRVVHGFGSVHVPENREIGVQLFSRLTEWLETGVIVPNKVEVLPDGLAGIPDGLERLKQDKVSGKKLVAHPQETA
ncbi:GroES-like protein [Polyporus arcularius HHB13444]|uniref:GroES-like protein n=1 Tax=Polyporus arcularius HHB13444 TaxID=1314778 RepID=A0A5C3NXV5_9APHY|nr:GroES-like protein [Polyporus arcularius HHB13444]